ncbi:MAG: Gfo/Idh/MocA family oxidoreductase [Planctomycetota bacterium]
MLQNRPSPSGFTRRDFLRTSTLAAGAFAVPAIVPARVRGPHPPSERIAFGIVGCGRQARGADIPELLGLPGAQVVAVCDVDSKRAADAKAQVEKAYAEKTAAGTYAGCAVFRDFRELLARSDVDAVAIGTPDHWHGLPAIAAVRAGKDVFLQKPLTRTIAEGRLLSDEVHRHGRVLQVGSQQRSDARFRRACELVRNGRIGDLKTIRIGLPIDPSGEVEPAMPVPANLDYEFWLGPTPPAPYTEKRVHPQSDYSRPGWLRIETYCAGMITGWGSHHLDIAQWGHGTEYEGPVEVRGSAQFPSRGLWNVHGTFRVEYAFADGVQMIVTDEQANPLGVTFQGSAGRVFVTRGAIDAEPKSLLDSAIGPDEIHLYESADHKENLLDCIRTRAQPVAPVEIAHRSNSLCLMGLAAMHLDRPLRWDARRERFLDDAEADAWIDPPLRAPWTLEKA